MLASSSVFAAILALPSPSGPLREPPHRQDPPPRRRSRQEPDFGVLGRTRLLHPLRDLGDPLHDPGGGRGQPLFGEDLCRDGSWHQGPPRCPLQAQFRAAPGTTRGCVTGCRAGRCQGMAERRFAKITIR